MDRLEELNRELERLRASLGRRRELTARAEDLAEQRRRLTAQAVELGEVLSREEEDVRQLEGATLTALFQRVLGRREERLETERGEALAARLKYETATRVRDDVGARLAAVEAERRALNADETRYAALLTEKGSLLRDPETAEQVRRMEERLDHLRGVRKEAAEAIDAGRGVAAALSRAREELNSAEGWGVYDMLGGGLIATAVKHSHIDSARDSAYEAQTLMSRFRTELADVKLSMDLHFDEDGFLNFADYFFDGLIADWMVQSGIEASARSVEAGAEQVEDLLWKLEQLRRNAEAEETDLSAQLRALLERA